MKSLILGLLISSTAFGAGFFDLKDTSIDGKEFPMSSLKGKVLLVVNIASQCGYTEQLKDLEALHQKYKAKGFSVVGVPSNDFGGQTPEDDKKMKEFCEKKYNVTFPLLSKKTIIGKDKRPIYQFLVNNSPKNMAGDVKWNFEKFIINKDGWVAGRLNSQTKPMDELTIKMIESNLK